MVRNKSEKVQFKSYYARLSVALGPEFDVVEHDNHWHIEFDPDN